MGFSQAASANKVVWMIWHSLAREVAPRPLRLGGRSSLRHLTVLESPDVGLSQSQDRTLNTVVTSTIDGSPEGFGAVTLHCCATSIPLARRRHRIISVT